MNPPNMYPSVTPPSSQCIDPRLLTDSFCATCPENTPTFMPVANDDGSPSANRMHVPINNHQQEVFDECRGNNQRQQNTNRQASTGFGAQPEQQQQHRNQQYQQYQQYQQCQQYQYQQDQQHQQPPQPQQQLESHASIPQNPQWGTLTGLDAQTHGETAAFWQLMTEVPNAYSPQQQATMPTSPPYANAGQPTPPIPNKTGMSQSPKSTKPQGVSKGRQALTKEERLAKHKQSEAIRRNMRQIAYEYVRDQVQDAFKDGTRKENSESHILPCAVKQLECLLNNNRRTMAHNQQLRADLINRGAQRSPAPNAAMQ
ncbi:hypothetical protein N7G274_006457 [Stereocaulon virgatum]|uniref:BHLH domain-containing protein n=1 Tax=Stereocaulon virgatum TaxID=373712 RepID=A0ABR4A8C6_9LECA